MEAVNKDDFDKVLGNDPYYNGRWEYMQTVIDMVQRHKIVGQTLELGCYTFPLFKGSDTWDLNPKAKAKYQYDATEVPWPFKASSYALFVALQTFEHLDGWQAEAFDEAARVAKHLVLSFPYRWDCPDDPIHHNITEHTIEGWASYRQPKEVVKVGRRIVYYWQIR